MWILVSQVSLFWPRLQDWNPEEGIQIASLRGGIQPFNYIHRGPKEEESRNRWVKVWVHEP